MQKDIKDFFEKHGYTVDKSENIWKRQEGYDLEILFFAKNNIQIYLWKNHIIKGQIRGAKIIEQFEEYENLLVNECFLEDKEVYIDFKNCICDIKRKGE